MRLECRGILLEISAYLNGGLDDGALLALKGQTIAERWEVWA
jgi:hypothetical protein